MRGDVPLKHGRDVVVIAAVGETRLLVLDLHDLLVRHHLPQHQALRDGKVLLALHKGLELAVHALDERGLERELERSAAEELAPVEAG